MTDHESPDVPFTILRTRFKKGKLSKGKTGHLFRICLKNSYELHYPSINHIPNLSLVSLILFEFLPIKNCGQFTKIVSDSI